MSDTLKTLFSPRAAKAWVAGATSLVSALLMGNQDHVIDLNDWLITALAVIGSVAAVFGIPNQREKGDNP